MLHHAASREVWYFLFANPSVSKFGFWSMLDEARTDLAMLLESTFLLLVGAGHSIDAALERRLTGSPTGEQR